MNRQANVGVLSAPRGLSIDAAAAYTGCRTASAFRAWVRKGMMPKPIPGTHVYDRKAIDLALDRMSRLSRTVSEQSPYEEWKKREGAA